ncbi:MAG: SusE domain-containing protein [Tannerella sp.]|jgi:hypothetical protein|nr:SusE domain-containing protein [Tannerella sp.]
MKTISNQLIIVSALILAFTSCKEEMGKINDRLSAVEVLIEPADAKSVVLLPEPTATLYFEWEPCKVEDSGTALYQIVFDKADGNFSNPVYVTNSDNNGYRNYVTITHKQMNKIAKTMGIGPSATGTLKWTVFSTKGLQSMKATRENTIAITRLAGFDDEDIPIDLFVTGEASEGGTDLSKAHKMKAIAAGEFEVYTKLSAGKPFYFVSDTKGSPAQFSTAGGLVMKDGTATVAADGVYRIKLDFTTGACTYTLVTRIGLFFSPDNKILFDLPYAGYGVFQAKNQTVTFKQESWGRDERYKFRMFMKENGGADAEKELEWATLNPTDARPTASSPPSYYYLNLIDNLTQWDNKWKLMGDFDDVPATYTIYLQADQPYTHSIAK